MTFDSVKTFNTIRNLENARDDAFAFMCGHMENAPGFIREYEEDFLTCLSAREEAWRQHYSSDDRAEEQKLLREIDRVQERIEDEINQKIGALQRRLARQVEALRLNNYQLYKMI